MSADGFAIRSCRPRRERCEGGARLGVPCRQGRSRWGSHSSITTTPVGRWTITHQPPRLAITRWHGYASPGCGSRAASAGRSHPQNGRAARVDRNVRRKSRRCIGGLPLDRNEPERCCTRHGTARNRDTIVSQYLPAVDAARKHNHLTCREVRLLDVVPLDAIRVNHAARWDVAGPDDAISGWMSRGGGRHDETAKTNVL